MNTTANTTITNEELRFPAKTVYESNGNSQYNLEKWYAIYTRSRHEKKIFQVLCHEGYSAFLPMTKERRIWSDRVKSVRVPLLPRYVFVKMHRTQFPEIYFYPGFVRFVSFKGKPCEIRESELSLLEKITSNNLPVDKTTSYGVGEWVRIVRGPLKGQEGRVERKRGNSRIIFQLESMKEAISVEVQVSEVEKI